MKTDKIKSAEEIQELNKRHYQHKERLEILNRHLGDEKYYSTGELHLSISDAMEEYANQFKSQPKTYDEETVRGLVNNAMATTFSWVHKHKNLEVKNLSELYIKFKTENNL